MVAALVAAQHIALFEVHEKLPLTIHSRQVLASLNTRTYNSKIEHNYIESEIERIIYIN